MLPAKSSEEAGMTAWPKPSFSASFRRCCACATGPDARPKADFAEIDAIGRQGNPGEGRHQGRGHREVGGRLDDPVAAGDVEIDVVLPKRTPQCASSTASTIDRRLPNPSRRWRGAACRAGRARPAPGSRRAPAACPRCRRTPPCPALERCGRRGRAPRGWHLLQTLAGHLEDADLVGGAEAVLGRAQDAVVVPAVALETQHRRPCARPRAGRRSGRPW
jgi:hypothetical protein